MASVCQLAIEAGGTAPISTSRVMPPVTATTKDSSRTPNRSKPFCTPSTPPLKAKTKEPHAGYVQPLARFVESGASARGRQADRAAGVLDHEHLVAEPHRVLGRPRHTKVRRQPGEENAAEAARPEIAVEPGRRAPVVLEKRGVA